MARTPSNMLALGTKAVPFSLWDSVSLQTKSLEELKGEKGTFILFMCNHCPFVKHINACISTLAKEYQPKGIQFIAINSNDVANYPEDAPELMTELAKTEDFTFPYLFDETQEIAKAYDAACTPDLYLYNSDLELVYRGQLDDSRPGNEKEVTGKDLKIAFDHLLKNEAQEEFQMPSIGCNIKWK